MRDYLGHLIALLLFLNAFRLGTTATLGSPAQLRFAVFMVLVLQLAIPVFVIGVFLLFGFSGPTATALVIMACASSITGAFNLTTLLGHDPAVSQRLLIAGTALLPLTILPVFLLFPDLGDPDLILGTAMRLLLVIGVSAGLAHVLRTLLAKHMTERNLKNVDGVSVIVMAVVVIGLMSALGPSIYSAPLEVIRTLVIVFAANFGLQIVCYLCLSAAALRQDRVGISVVAGNRNMALFLAALPVSVTDPILLFIACYQLPMYLTPILMKPFYGNRLP